MGSFGRGAVVVVVKVVVVEVVVVVVVDVVVAHLSSISRVGAYLGAKDQSFRKNFILEKQP